LKRHPLVVPITIRRWHVIAERCIYSAHGSRSLKSNILKRENRCDNLWQVALEDSGLQNLLLSLSAA
jgi:hypothetical protein